MEYHPDHQSLILEAMWTTTPPTETGWYWAFSRDPDDLGQTPALVFVRDGKSWDINSAHDPEFFPEPVDYIHTHWLGPLPVPAPPD